MSVTMSGARPRTASSYHPAPSLLPGLARSICRACVTIPARDEEATLPACLDALARQVDLDGRPLRADAFEVLLLLNNCTDQSAARVQRWHADYPHMQLRIAEREFSVGEAHAGTARRLLMDTAWQRLGGDEANGKALILATDADSTVAPDWLAQNAAAVRAGADAVGGAVRLLPAEIASLPSQVRDCYMRDRRYAELIAQLEHLLDPQEGDPWPRHLDHFGSSLACTAPAYARAGGMPAAAALEDEAFVDRLRRADLRLRHEPRVRVFTSARLAGRATVGLAGQLRLWSELAGEHEHTAPSAAYLAHRFQTLHRLRLAFVRGVDADLTWLPPTARSRVRSALRAERGVPAFFSAVDCDGLVDDTFAGERYELIVDSIKCLDTKIASLR